MKLSRLKKILEGFGDNLDLDLRMHGDKVFLRVDPFMDFGEDEDFRLKRCRDYKRVYTVKSQLFDSLFSLKPGLHLTSFIYNNLGQGTFSYVFDLLVEFSKKYPDVITFFEDTRTCDDTRKVYWLLHRNEVEGELEYPRSKTPRQWKTMGTSDYIPPPEKIPTMRK